MHSILLPFFFFFLFDLKEFILLSVINKCKFLLFGKDFSIVLEAATSHRLYLLDMSCRGKHLWISFYIGRNL